MTSEQRDRYKKLQRDVKEGIIGVGSEITLVIGLSGSYGPLKRHYGETGIIKHIPRLNNDTYEEDEGIFKVKMSDGNSLSVFWSEFSYTAIEQNPMARHLRKLIANKEK